MLAATWEFSITSNSCHREVCRVLRVIEASLYNFAVSMYLSPRWRRSKNPWVRTSRNSKLVTPNGVARMFIPRRLPRHKTLGCNPLQFKGSLGIPRKGLLIFWIIQILKQKLRDGLYVFYKYMYLFWINQLCFWLLLNCKEQTKQIAKWVGTFWIGGLLWMVGTSLLHETQKGPTSVRYLFAGHQ